MLPSLSLQALSFDSFVKVLGSLVQFKMAKASLLADPTLMLSVLQQLCGTVNTTGIVDTKLAMVTQVSQLLNMWPTFWNSTKTVSGGYSLDMSTYTDAISSLIPGASSANVFDAFKSTVVTKTPAESLLAVISSIGDMASSGTSGNTQVSTDSFMNLLGSYTSLLSFVNSGSN